MKKLWFGCALSLCLCLLLLSGWLLINPTTAQAADGTAKCPGGSTVSCEPGADRCRCEDYKGCTSYWDDGTKKETKCSSSEELYLY